MDEVTAYIGLGSNLGDRVDFIERAIKELKLTPGIRVVRVSALQETEPVGPLEQPHFMNSVACIETSLEPLALLDTLLSIERRLGRIRKERWGPRTIDLDILLYGDRVMDHPRLRIPHPEMQNRRFVLDALEELGIKIRTLVPR